MPKELTNARIFVIDDEWQNVHLLERFLKHEGFENVTGTTDSRQVLTLYKELKPDLVLLDLVMPFLDGFQVMKQLAGEIRADDYVPILVLTADITTDTKKRALSSGAKDFLTKPLDLTEVSLRINNLLETRLLHLEIRAQNKRLEQTVFERTQELEESRIDILERLAIAGEYRDHATGEHTRRVGNVAAALARAAGSNHWQVELIRRAAPLHDIGKIGIPDHILLKAGKLDFSEIEIMKTHTLIGPKILGGSANELLKLAATIARAHHERWDGTGYPCGLVGPAIPLRLASWPWPTLSMRSRISDPISPAGRWLLRLLRLKSRAVSNSTRIS